jgi:hypothetical protein
MALKGKMSRVLLAVGGGAFRSHRPACKVSCGLDEIPPSPHTHHSVVCTIWLRASRRQQRLPWSVCRPPVAVLQPQVKKDFQEIVMAAWQDPFYQRNMYANFGDIGVAVKQLVDEFQARPLPCLSVCRSVCLPLATWSKASGHMERSSTASHLLPRDCGLSVCLPVCLPLATCLGIVIRLSFCL